MAPEMFKYGADKRGRPNDIWAAGITLFNLLTKKFPFSGKGVLALADNIKNQLPDLSLISDD